MSSSSWQAELNVPSPGAASAGAGLGSGLRASFGLEGVRPLAGLGASLALSYRWLGDGPAAVSAAAGGALELSYRFPLSGTLSLRPSLECGAAFAVPSPADVGGPWGLDLAASLGVLLRLGGREYLSLAPSARWAPSRAGPVSFGLTLGSRSEAAWLVPVADAGPRLGGVPVLFSPDGDGRDDGFEVRLRYRNPRAVSSWSIVVRDSGGAAFARRGGYGPPPASFSWDGLSDDARLVDPAADYSLTVETVDVLGRASAASARFTVDILVIKVGERYKVRVPPIVFPSNSADLGPAGRAGSSSPAMEGAAWMVAANQATLDRLIALFSRFPEYSIIVEGHANAVRWADPAAFAAEQRGELVPLSLSRAEAVRGALVALGIAPSRIRSVGLGGAEPLVPFSRAEEAWRNRRVEFVLVKKD